MAEPTNVNALSLFASLSIDSTEFDKGLDEAVKKMTAFGQTLTNSVTNATTGANTALTNVTNAATTGATAMNTITDATEQATRIIGQMGEEALDSATALNKTRTTAEDFGEEINKTAEEEKNYKRETENAGEATQNYSKNVEEATNKTSKFKETIGKGVTVALKALGAAMAAAATGAVALVKQSVDAYGNYEQLVGGVNTLFSNLEGTVSAAPTVLENAANAYKTAGMSANQYMETVTSFSAALVAGLEGDYQKAAEVSDMAIRDMSDNMNKMGSSMQSIQNAYQGFAKQNYTMLDNLKLGYGGTKTEMERLLKDAEEFSGVQYDISNLADVYNAIHVIQEQMGITGTTAKEAADTITGSFGSLGAAWQNLVTGFADQDADLSGLIDNVVYAAEGAFTHILPIAEQAVVGIGNFVEEIAPVIAEKLPEVVSEVLPGILQTADDVVNTLVQALPGLLTSVVDVVPQVISDVTTTVVNSLPDIVTLAKDAVFTLAKGIKESAPSMISAAAGAAKEIVTTLTSPDTLREFTKTAWELMEALAEGIADNLPVIVEAAAELAQNFADFFIDPYNLETIYTSGFKILGSLVEGIIKSLPQLVTAATAIPVKIVEVIFTTDWADVAVKLMDALAEGIAEGFGDLTTQFENGLKIIDGMLGTNLAEWAEKWNATMKSMGASLYDLMHPDAGEAEWSYEDALRRTAEFLPVVEDAAEETAKAIYLPTEAARQMAGETAQALSLLPKVVKETADNMGEVLDSVTKYGIVKTVGEALTDVQKEADSLAKEMYTAAKEDADRQTTRLKLSYDEQLSMWENIKDQFVEGSEQYEKALDEIYKIRDKKQDEANKAAEKAQKEVESAAKKAAQEAEKLEKQRTKAQQEELKKREKAYTEYEKNINSITDKIKDIENSYADTLKSRSEDIYNSFGLFEKVPERILVSGVDLYNNLQGQIDTLEKFYGDIEKLQERGVSDALVAEIQAMGVGALDQLDALLDLSDDKLTEYDELFTKKHDLAADVAENQLTTLKADTERQIEEQLDGLADMATEKGKDFGLDFASGIVDGIKAGYLTIEQGISRMLDITQEQLLGEVTTASLKEGTLATATAESSNTKSAEKTENTENITVNVNGIQFQNFTELATAIGEALLTQRERGVAGYAGA